MLKILNKESGTCRKWLTAYHIVLSVLLVLTVCFIWGQSLMSKEASSKESEGFTEKVVEPVVHAVCGDDVVVNEGHVRKFAHAFEHALLGFELLLLFWESGAVRACLRALGCGVLVAFLDESLQMLTGRGPAILDVWIDTSGVACGILLAVLAVTLVKCVSRNGNKKKAV